MLLQTQFSEAKQYIEKAEIKKQSISKVPVAWHLDHLLKVIIQVMSSLKDSDPLTFKWRFNLVRTYIYLRGSIPRGKARAPKKVRPPKNITTDSLYQQFNKAVAELENMDTLSKNSNFNHPYFGYLNLNMTKRFLKLHTEHHLKIIRDILKIEK